MRIGRVKLEFSSSVPDSNLTPKPLFSATVQILLGETGRASVVAAPPPLSAMSDPFSINGGSIVALQGKDCVGIACDLRLGQQALTLSTDFPKIFPMGEKVFLGLSGLATDVQTLYNPHPCLFF
jgi:hypothetical protein